MRLIVFDMDGTLVDSAALMVESARAACDLVGVVAPPDAEIRSISGLTLVDGLRRLVPDADDATLNRLAQGYRDAYSSSVAAQLREPLFPGTLDAIERLAAHEDTLLAVATGKALRGAQRVLALHEIAHHFTSVQTPDHNPSKPHPGMLQAAMSQVGVRPEMTVMIGDTNHDMEMARAAGVSALGVSWGYHLPDALIAAGAHHVIDDYAALDAAIDTLLEPGNA